VLLLKPRIDDRYGEAAIVSRAGLKERADVVLEEGASIDPSLFEGLDCVLVDEAQFLSAKVVEELRALTLTHNVPVICYGLRTDFRTHLFEGSKRLLELADSIEEVKVTCQFCNRKAILNMRLTNGKATLEGAQVEIGADERYAPACFRCYNERLPLPGSRHGSADPG
jgi:thymidine kinase